MSGPMEVPRSREDFISEACNALQCNDFDGACTIVEQLVLFDDQAKLADALGQSDYETARQVIEMIEARAVRTGTTSGADTSA